MGNIIIIMLSYQELKKHKENKHIFFGNEEKEQEKKPFLFSIIKKEKVS